MIDVHTHILPFVDDGSSDVESSLDMVNECYLSGVKEFVFTPHYRIDEYETSVEEIKRVYNEFKAILSEKFADVKTYLGQEIFCDGKIYELLNEGKVLTINGGKHVLLEFNYTAETDIADYVYNLSNMGYVPIVAHVERYEYLTDIRQIAELKENGALIQVNSSSVTGKESKPFKRKVKNLIKNGLVDFIASDVHSDRYLNIADAYKYVAFKFSKSVADDLFNNNATKLLSSDFEL